MKTRLNIIISIVAFVLLSFSGIVNATNLASNATATASSLSGSNNASLAIDGNDATRWESEQGVDPQTFTITLDDTYTLGEIKIHWEAANAKAYTVSVSTDNSTWTEVHSETNGASADRWDIITLSNPQAKYIKLDCTSRNLTYGYSIFEIEVYAGVNPEMDATLSDIIVDGTSISAFSSSTTDYTVSVDPGTTTVPTITATTTQTGAQISIVDATSILGTTEITVTSSDNSTTKTYSISFIEQYIFASLDFEPSGIGADWAWSVGENGTNPAMEFVANPSILEPNTSATVAKFTAEASGASWALIHTEDVGTFTFDVDHAILKVMVYKSVISDVGVKFEGDNEVQILVSNTKVNEWEELTFDFSDEIGKTFSKMVFIPDFADRSQNNIVYWDNLNYSEGVEAPEPSGMEVLDFEDDGIGQAIRWSIFENGLGATSVEFVDNPSIGDVNASSKVAKIAVDADASGWIGAESKAPDVGPITWSSDLKTITMKVYSTVATTVGLKMVPSSGDGGAHAPVEATIAEANTWQEITLDYSEFIGGAFATNMDIIVVHPNMGTSKGAYDFYFDDITFLSGATSIDETVSKELSIYPNPTTGQLTIDAADGDLVSVYNMVGQLQQQSTLESGSISIDGLENGVYFVRVNDQLSKIVKE